MKNLTNFISFFIILVYPNVINSEDKSVLNITKDDFVMGDPEAPITIIEYASMSCSHCASFHNDTLGLIKEEYIDTGKVKFVFRDFPYNYPALLGSMVMRCIPSNIRYNYTNALYLLQKSWVHQENAKTTQELYKIMQSGGMTKEEFDACITNVDLENKILEEIIAAQNEFNIRTTPSFLINGKLIEGNKPIKDFRQIIDKILSEY
jgi:protein-disulfide isomerase